MASEKLETQREKLVKGVGIPAALGAGVAYLFAWPVLPIAAGAGALGFFITREPKAKGTWDATLTKYQDGSTGKRIWVRDPTFGINAADPTIPPTQVKYITLNKSDGSMSSVEGPADSTADAFGHAMDVAK